MRLIDRDAIHWRPDENWELYATAADIRAIPIVDAVVVTRCKDCKHAKQYERADGTAGYFCGHPQNIFTYGERWDRVFEPIKEPDDFCSYGEPKEEPHADDHD